MRIPVTLALGILVTTATAQNWALLNPAYKYNYSNDGTDTISDQVFVTHIDTLGVDSFRYELNLIAKVCDTCTAPGFFLLLNQPQFMQRKVDAGPSVWHFHDPGSMVVLPHAGLGETWVFDTLAGVTATVAEVDIAQVFGNSVQRKVISLSTGDAIMISETYGALSWNGHDLIGVHGPEVGRLTPSLEEMFPYQNGDEVEYFASSTTWDDVVGTVSQLRNYKFHVQGSAPLDDGILFNGSMIDHAWQWSDPWPWGLPPGECCHQTTFGNTWTAGHSELPWYAMVNSYPGQLVPFDVWNGGNPAYCIAQHRIDSAGYYRCDCARIPLATDPGTEAFAFFLPPGYADSTSAMIEDTDHMFLISQAEGPGGVSYRSGLGLDRFRGGVFESSYAYCLAGAIISGDTIGTVHSDEEIIALSVPMNGASSSNVLAPNPTSDIIFLSYSVPGTMCSITDLHGRTVRQHKITSTNERIDVQPLSPGVYVLMMEGARPQRFVIAR